MVFFTMSGNILYTYVLPGLPAFAMMVAEMISLRFDTNASLQSRWLYAGLIIPIAGLVFMALVWTAPNKLNFEKNQKYLVEIYQNTRQSEKSQLSYAGERLFSINFHTQGQAKRITLAVSSINALSNNSIEDYLIIEKDHLNRLPAEHFKNFEIVEEYRKHALLKEK